MGCCAGYYREVIMANVSKNGLRTIVLSEYFRLVLILVLAGYIAFLPHRSYPYLLHVDEWVHLAYSRAMMDAGSLTFADPFSVGAAVPYNPHLEAGFHLFWGVFQSISGLSAITIYRYFPGIIFMITILCAYILGKRGGYGWEAALFTCLIPSTIGILGPAFLVPVALGLPFILLALFLALYVRTVPAYLVLFIIISFLLATHAPEAVGIVLILTPYFLLNIRRNWRETVELASSLLLPFFIIFPWIAGMLWPTFKSLFEEKTLPTYIAWPQVIQSYGILPAIICATGIYFMLRNIERKGYALVFGLVALLIMLMLYIQLHYGVGIMYDRGLMYAMLLMSIIAGYGLWSIERLDLTKLLVSANSPPNTVLNYVKHYAGHILAVVLIVITLVLAIPIRQKQTYYYMIDTTDYETFTWINDNVEEKYLEAVLDPWKATAFAALTGRRVYSRIHSYPEDTDRAAYEFLNNNCVDTAFLRENGISLVYTRGACDNPDLTPVRANVYPLKQ